MIICFVFVGIVFWIVFMLWNMCDWGYCVCLIVCMIYLYLLCFCLMRCWCRMMYCVCLLVM